MNIKGKNIIITGASSGIGSELAKKLASRGGKLALLSRNVQTMETLADEIIRKFPDCSAPVFMYCDIRDMTSAIYVLNKCGEKLGGIDILINNAGIGVYGMVDNTSLQDFYEIMDVNFFSAVNLTLKTIPYMKEQNSGLIINISSVAAIHGVPYLSAYCASKSALVAFSESIRSELKSNNISVMVVYPGYTQTDFFINEKKVGGARRPNGPYASPENVAESIIKGIINNKSEIVLSNEGRLLKNINKIFPKMVDYAMFKIACQLKTK